jgi:CRP-like cAMP-binding protein
MTLPEISGHPVRRITVDIVGANEVVGWSSIVEPYIYTLTAICLQKTKVLSINGLNLRRLMSEDQQISNAMNKGLIRVIADRLAVTRHVMISERLVSPLEKAEVSR